MLPGRVAQSITCQASDGVYGHSPHFRLIVQEVCCQLQSKVCVNRLLKLAQEKVWFGELTVQP